MSRRRRTAYRREREAEIETWEARVDKALAELRAHCPCNYGHAWCEGPKPSPRDRTIAPPVRCSKCTRDSVTVVPLLDALAGEEFSS